METQTNGVASAIVTISDLAQRPAFQLSRKQFKAVGEYAKVLQAVQELSAKRDYLIAEAAKLENEIELASMEARRLGNEVFEG